MKQLSLFLLCVTAGSLVAVMPPGFLSAQASRPDSCYVTTPNGIVAGSSERNERNINPVDRYAGHHHWRTRRLHFHQAGAAFIGKVPQCCGFLPIAANIHPFVRYFACKHYSGNAPARTHALEPNGTVVFKPGGAGFQTKEGALGMKFGWTRGIRGKINQVGDREDSKITFVTRVEKIGDGPAYRLKS